MKKVTIWHNPRCSKSRETLELLQNRNMEIEVIEYLETPPSELEIERVLKLLGIEPRDLMRHNEPVYQELNLDNAALDHESLIEAMHSHPVLIQRPVVIANDKARIGRPSEAVLDIL